ncbi:unnamed protein product [Malus baccata var. baccata]
MDHLRIDHVAGSVTHPPYFDGENYGAWKAEMKSFLWAINQNREANTRCTWFTQIGYVHGVEEFSLIVKGLHKYIGSSSHLVSTSE